jgi:hypothetical protein
MGTGRNIYGLGGGGNMICKKCNEKEAVNISGCPTGLCSDCNRSLFKNIREGYEGEWINNLSDEVLVRIFRGIDSAG